MSVVCSEEELNSHEQNDCYYRKGGISAVAVLKTDHGITDFSNATQWQDAINAGTARIIKKIKGTMPDPSPVEGENPIACGSETIVDGYDYTFEWKDFNVNSNNDEFYRQLNQSEFPGLAWFYCEEDEVRVLESGVTFVSLPRFAPESNKEKQMYFVTAKWSQSVQEDFPTLYGAPAGIFTA